MGYGIGPIIFIGAIFLSAEYDLTYLSGTTVLDAVAEQKSVSKTEKGVMFTI